MTEHAPPFAYANRLDRAPGRVLSVLGRVWPGLASVQAQVDPYADAWRAANLRALASSGPLWIALGDSLSQGIGAPSYDRGWVGQLQRRLATTSEPYRVVNLSATGARIQDVLDVQLPVMDLLRTTPSLVTLLIGSNDLFARSTRGGLEERYARLLRRLPVGSVVATLPNPSRTARAVNDVVEQVAAAHGLVVAETREPRTTRWRGKLAADHFHPNERGYASIADVFFDAVTAVPASG